MAQYVKYLRFTKPVTTTGVQSIEVGFLGKAMWLWSVRRPSTGATDGAYQTFGITDGVTQHTRNIRHPDNEAATTSSQNEQHDCVVYQTSATSGATPTLEVRGVFNGFSGTAMEINWTTNDAAADIYHCVVLGGSEVDVTLVSTAVDAATKVITSLTFRPESFVTLPGAEVDTYNLGAPFGSIHGFGLSNVSTNYAVWTLGRGTGGASDCYCGGHTDRFASIRVANLAGATELLGAAITARSANGYTITRVAGATTCQMHVLAIRGIEFAMGTFNTPASPGTVTLSPGFDPDVLMLEALGTTNGDSMGLAVGAADAGTGDTGGTWIGGTDNANPSVYARAHYEDKIIQTRAQAATGSSSAVTGEATVTSHDETSTVLNFTTVPATPYGVLWLAMAPSEVSDLPVYEDPCSITEPQVSVILKTTPDNVGAPSTYDVRQYGSTTMRDASTYRGGYKGPRLLPNWGPIRRVASRWRTGHLEVQSALFKLADTDRTIKAALATNGSSLINTDVMMTLTSQANRLLAADQRILFAGKLAKDDLIEEMYSGEVRDIITLKFSLERTETMVPQGTIEDSFPGYGYTNTDTINLGVVAAPIIGGTHTDAGATPPNGRVPIPYVGTIVGLDANTYHVGLVAGHACKGGIISAYHPGATADDAAVALTWGTDNFAPGQTGWSGVNPSGAALYTSVGGRWFTLVLMKTGTTIGDDFADGKLQIHVNTHGFENSGDGLGTEITNLQLQYEHCMRNFFLQAWESGAWLDSPEIEIYPGGTTIPRMDSDSWFDASNIGGDYVVGGFQGAFVIGLMGKQQSLRNVLAEFNTQSLVSLCVDKYARFRVVMLDRNRARALDGRRSITDYRDTVRARPLSAPVDEDNLINNIRGGWKMNYRKGQFELLGQIGDSPSFTKYEDRGVEFVSLTLIQDTTTAAGWGTQRLAFMAYARRMPDWQEGLCGLRNDVLDFVPISHPTNVTAASRAIWIQSQAINSDMAVDSTAWDVDDLLT